VSGPTVRGHAMASVREHRITAPLSPGPAKQAAPWSR